MAESMIVPATLAFEELERLVRHLGDELAFFRRRALEAERRLKEVTPSDAAVTERETVQALEARLARAESENEELRARLAEAAERTRGMADRMRFLRQQQEAEGER
jgi:predicted  nucleic acid-binding Zn-ribbon protein